MRSDLSPQAGRGRAEALDEPTRTAYLLGVQSPDLFSYAPSSAAALLPDRFQKWFASRGWSPREHQLDLLKKARADRSALLIAPTGAGKTLAGFLPTLVELSSPLHPRSGGEGSGVGRLSARTTRSESAEAPPAPDLESELRSPRTPPRATRAGGGESTVRVAPSLPRGLISTGRGVVRSRGLHTLYISPLQALA